MVCDSPLQVVLRPMSIKAWYWQCCQCVLRNVDSGNNVLMAVVCVVTVGLGMVDECAVAALGLPKSTGSEVVASEKASCPMDGAAKVAGGEVQKFHDGRDTVYGPHQASETYCVWGVRGYGELSQEALRAEFRRGPKVVQVNSTQELCAARTQKRPWPCGVTWL